MISWFSCLCFGNFDIFAPQSGFSAVGSALRSGRRGRPFKSGNPDHKKGNSNLNFLFVLQSRDEIKVVKSDHFYYSWNIYVETLRATSLLETLKFPMIFSNLRFSCSVPRRLVSILPCC